MCSFRKYKKLYYLFFLIFIIFIAVSDVRAYEDKKIQGFIKRVNIESDSITVKNHEYILSQNCTISFNGNKTKLNGLRPPYPGYYYWADITLNDNGLVKNISVYYKVLEGTVEDISYKEGWLEVSVFSQEPIFTNNIYRYYLPDHLLELKKSIKKSDHIIFITALDRILYLQ
ncbi:MAG: hypothetical protein ACOCQW_00705 [Halanaerobiaceae bacterium]